MRGIRGGMGVWVRCAGVGSVVLASVSGAGCGPGSGTGTGIGIGGSAVVEVGDGVSLEVSVHGGGFTPPGTLYDVLSSPTACAVAVGLRHATRGGMEAGYWSSADCVGFTGPGSPMGDAPGDGLPSDDETSFTGVAARPQGGFVVVGYREERADDAPSDMTVDLWDGGTGPDTLRRATPPEPTGHRAHQTAEDVIVTQAGTVLVVGTDGPIGSGAYVWRSPDLATAPFPQFSWDQAPATWQQVPLPRSSPDVVYAEATEILQRSDGTLVLVGDSGTTQDGREQDPATWSSTDDGRTWTPADPNGALGPDGPMRNLAAVTELAGSGGAGGDLLAVGRFGDGGCLSRSGDGATWSTASPETGRPCGQMWTADVSASEHGVVVVGSIDGVRPPGSGDGRSAIWYSADGAEWTRVELAPGVAHHVLPTATGFLVLGGTAGDIGWTARVDVTS